MSKSLARVERALKSGGAAYKMQEMAVETRTAKQAAEAIGCDLDHIAKSIIVSGLESGKFFLFITAGGNEVNGRKASNLMGERVSVPNADQIRETTGFVIGGVAPVGHLTPIEAFFDPMLLTFPKVYAAGGTPRHVFEIAPFEIVRLTEAKVVDFTPDSD